MELTHTLTLLDLTLFGILSIMGSGGFNLIGSAVRSGGRWWILAYAMSAVLLLGASHTYSRAILHTKHGNTLESDIVEAMFGQYAGALSATGILVFNIVSISVILVLCSHILFPNGTWLGQIIFALMILAGMTALSLQGIDTNRDTINTMGFALLIVLSSAAVLGYVGLFLHKGSGGNRDQDQPFNMRPFRTSMFLFFFILAGSDVLAKFTEEANDPADIPRSFFTSNIVSDILTFGIASAFATWVARTSTAHANTELAFEHMLGYFLGGSVEEGFKYVVVFFLIATTFVVFLAISRYLYGLGKTTNIRALSSLNSLNEQNVPYVAVGVIAVLSAIGILNNHTDTLVMVSDLGLIMTLLLVSAAATVADWGSGETVSAIVSGITTAGFGGFLSLYAIG